MTWLRSLSRGRWRRSVWILTGLLVLAAQSASAIHELDPQNQAPEHVCEFCVAAANLDAVDVGQTELCVPAHAIAELLTHADAGITEASIVLPPSRGPPAVT